MLRQYRFALTGWLVGVTCHAICPSWATANAPAIRLAPVVRKLLDDPATDASRRRHLAIFHGQWDQISDLTPAERARIALGKYQLHDESLQNGLAAPHASAVAALRRGDPQRVLDLLDLIKEPKTARTAVLRAQALDMTGNRSEALTTLLPWREKLERESFDDAEQLTAAARGLVMLAAYEGRPAHDYHTAMRFFAKAHSELDRLYWPAHLAEAELLVAKHNSKEAASALSLALELNPHSSRAWYLLGLIGLKQFDFAQAIACEQRLRQINPRHLLADLLQVQIRLTQADPQTAAVALTPALTAHPKHRLLIALKAATDALRYNEADLKATISRFESLWPGGAMVYHTVGTYLTMARQYDSAAQMFRLAIERDPNWPDPRSELGLILLQAGREQEAQKELAVAVDLDPFHTRAANSMKLVKHLLAYEQIATKHFVIKYHKGIDQVLARDIASDIESIYDRITETYGHRPRRQTLIEILPDDQWFAVRITGMPWIWTIGACTGNVIALTPPRHGKHQRGPFDWFDVVQHEFVHTVTLSLTNNRVPHWFTEACAVSNQETRRDFAACQLLAQALADQNLFDLDQINWAFVRPKTPRDRPLAYAQADWMLQYITSQFGHDAVITMLDVYRRGGSDSLALSTATRLHVAQFMEQFKGWALGQVQRWGLGPQGSDEPIDAELASTSPADDRLLNELMQRYPEHRGVLKVAAMQAMERNDLNTARQAVLRYATVCPIDPWPSKALTKLALRSGRMHDAIGPLERLDRLELKVADWAHQLANLHRAAGHYGAAAAAIRRAIRREPYNAPLRELAAAIDLQRHDSDGALYQIIALTLLEPQRAIHWVRLAALHQQRGEAEKAHHAAEKARRLDPAAPVQRFGTRSQ